MSSHTRVSGRVSASLGEIRISSDGQDLLCVDGLGSCVAVIIFSRSARAAGIAHVVMPRRGTGSLGSQPGWYADTAVRALVQELQEYGLELLQMRAMIAGGASLLSLEADIGQRNVAAVKEELLRLGIPLLREDTGGTAGRTVEFDPIARSFDVVSLTPALHAL